MPSFTLRERELIRKALRIATEDESIYGTAETDADRKKIDIEIEAIEMKLSSSWNRPPR